MPRKRKLTTVLPNGIDALQVPPGIYWQATGRGRWVLRFCHGKKRRALNIGDAHTSLQELYAAYDAELGRQQSGIDRQRWPILLLRNVTKNARTRNLCVALTLDDITARLTRCDWRCELTGIPFCDIKISGRRARPWIPSVDRVDSGIGYMPDNIRIVCASVNYAMNEFGETVLIKIADRLARRRR